MRFILFSILFIASSLKADGFNNFNIEKDSVQIKMDSIMIISEKKDTVVEILFSIMNFTGEKIWIWLDSDVSNKDEILIRKFFFKRENDFSIFDIATDPNMTVDWWHNPMKLKSFVKCLPSYEQFTFIFFTNSENFLSNHNIKDMVKVFGNRIIIKYCPDLNDNVSIDRISYPYNAIMIPYDNNYLFQR